jgi:release factor glutamine methyltransferase
MGAIARALTEAGIPDAEKEAELMVIHGTGTDRTVLYRDNPRASEAELSLLEGHARRRLRREPLQYILGEVEFSGLTIGVGPRVLIPRPESELLAEEAVRLLSGRGRVRVLDICTGSGCIALAIAKGLPEALVLGTDISREAIACAVENARLNSIENAEFLTGDLFEPVAGMRFDMVVSNPPYIKSGDMKDLQPEIRDWEPVVALEGGEDGLEFYRKILKGAPEHLENQRIILLELGSYQSTEIAGIAYEQLPNHALSILKDYAGIERIMYIVIV